MEKIRTSRSEWQSGIAKNITFIVTKDCQLACKYCYLVGKNTKERMSWEVAKQAIDYVLDHEDEMKEEKITDVGSEILDVASGIKQIMQT